MTMTYRPLRLLLMYAGAIPFVLLSLMQTQLITISPISPQNAQDLLVSYSLAIIAFLAGTLWTQRSGLAILASNILTLLAWIAAFVMPEPWPLFLLCFALYLGFDQTHTIHRDLRIHRIAVTLIVSLSLIGCWL